MIAFRSNKNIISHYIFIDSFDYHGEVANFNGPVDANTMSHYIFHYNTTFF